MSSLPLLYSKSNQIDEDEKLLESINYLRRTPGNDVRSKFAIAINFWLNIPQDKLDKIIDIIQILNDSGVLLDDIQDNSILRRGIPAAHLIYGIGSTINAAVYSIFIALEKVLHLQHSQVIPVAIEQLLVSLRGQGIEIYWRDNMRCPTEEEYKQMVLKKTGGLFMLIVELMQLFSKNKLDFRKLINLLALIFQIRDDYDNLVSKECMQRKSFCDDFTEGKFSFPIIHAIKTHPDDQQIMNILRQRTDDVELKKLGLSLLSQYGSFKYTRQILDKLTKDIREEMRKFPDNPYMMDFLNTLSDYNSVEVLYKA